MGGFKKESNNTIFEHDLFNLIVLHISRCCETMRNDCQKAANPLPNHEDKISNRLVRISGLYRQIGLAKMIMPIILLKPNELTVAQG